MNDRLLWTMRTQGAYYVVTGLWPVVALDHYMRATGQQSHGAVARVLGGVVAGVGVALAAGLIPPRARKWVGAGTAVALCAGGAYFGATGHGRAVNFTDAAIQAAFAASWLVDGRGRAS
ncbi:hypothetical protein BH11MYX1_BH11MYX1_02330 [soil metagenome]